MNSYFNMEPIPYFGQALMIYLIVMNLIGFLCMLIDKRKAILHQWRISEHTLLSLAVFGGGLGILLGMIVFHHKTRKLKFVFVIPLILILQFLFFCLCCEMM